jgi:hypothetical protein
MTGIQGGNPHVKTRVQAGAGVRGSTVSTGTGTAFPRNPMEDR